MSKIKISFIIRKSEIIWNYQNQKGKDFWSDVTEKISEKISPDTLTPDKRGNFQCNFYIDSDKEPDLYKKLCHDIVTELLGQKESMGVIVTVSSATVSKEESKEVKETEKIEKTEIPTEEKTVIQESEKKEITLTDKIESFKKLKEELLKVVKGQRHAVDEVVQTIFESEMFSINNTKRKGPLATLLFAGPSGVGKTFLSETLSELLPEFSFEDRPFLRVDMSGYSQPESVSELSGNNEMYKGSREGIVTGFVKKNPKCIILFDEVEKAHIDAILLFLQMLDGGYIVDTFTKEKVDFSNAIVIFTTNAGESLYEDTTVCDLSATPRKVILDGLRKDINPKTGEPFFPECITTRMANGHVILFNHLEPYALMEIIGNQIEKQIGFFEKSTGLRVEYDLKELSAFVLYNGGGTADARTLTGLARNIIVRELHEILMQSYALGSEKISSLQTINLTVDSREGNEEVRNLFENQDKLVASVFTDKTITEEMYAINTDVSSTSDTEVFKKQLRGITDFVIIDVLCGNVEEEHIPSDIEDFNSDGIRMFDYVREYSPETPVYILDSSSGSIRSFETLLARGAKGVIRFNENEPYVFRDALKEVTISSIINNATYSLGRSGRYLSYNCAQYIDDTCAVVSFERLQLKKAHSSEDTAMIIQSNTNTTITFDDIIGCKTAKKELREFRDILEDPRKAVLSGKKIPKGILFYGPPGTGKTMLAKAMANECKATFFATNATSFFNKYHGQTEENIREIFRKAKKYAPSIVFIDEIDAFAKARTGGDATHLTESALTTFLSEMDGFIVDEKRPVFIIAATNYEINGGPRVLDTAFVRRFDSKLYLPLPDEDERYELIVKFFEKHSINFGNGHEEALRVMAERTAGMSNADIENMNSNYLRTLGDEEPDRTKYLDHLDAYRFGDIRERDEKTVRQTAYHEGGHALIYRLCSGKTPLYLTVVSRGDYGGYMARSADDFSGKVTFGEFLNSVCCSLAGRAAEIEVYGEEEGLNTGASADIEHARAIITSSLKDYAMGETLVGEFDIKEAEKLLQDQFIRAKDLIARNRDILDKLVELLAEKNSLDEKFLDEFFTSQGI